MKGKERMHRQTRRAWTFTVVFLAAAAGGAEAVAAWREVVLDSELAAGGELVAMAGDRVVLGDGFTVEALPGRPDPTLVRVLVQVPRPELSLRHRTPPAGFSGDDSGGS